MKRDMTERQFMAALNKHGFSKPKAYGYVALANNPNVSVCMWNGGRRLRECLAYLLAADKREREKQARQATAQQG